MKHMKEDLIDTNKLRDVLEYYPPQVNDVRKHISKATAINAENIFVGNGAIEVIQAIMHRFVKGKVCIILPTFSSYYEFATEDCEVVFYNLKKEEDFKLDVEDFISFVVDKEIQNVVVINPNNPNGGYLSVDELKHLMSGLSHIDNLIIDESFIHFAYEDVDLFQISNEELITKNSNLCIVKSMSKDFGIAGIRCGYGVMSSKKVNALLKNGYLWNVSGLANYFFRVYSDEDFQNEYEVVRKKYIMNTLTFLGELSKLENIKTYTSKANFALVEILSGKSSFDCSIDLLVNSGIYVRDCSDKIGLDGEFLRIASRTFEENLDIISAIKTL